MRGIRGMGDTPAIPAIPNPFDPNAPPIFDPSKIPGGTPAVPGGGTDPNAPKVDPLPSSAQAVGDQAALVAIGQAYAKMSPAGQAQVYAGVKASGGGKDAYMRDAITAAAIGLAAGALAGYFFARR